MAEILPPLWLTRDAADSIAAQARRAALEAISAALPAWPIARRDALLRTSQAAWGVSAVTAAGLIAGNASAIAAAYSLRNNSEQERNLFRSVCAGTAEQPEHASLDAFRCSGRQQRMPS